jgi:CheY-like chemotaxis protein
MRHEADQGSPPISVLLVDDDAEVLRVVARLLESQGHHVMPARNGIEALRRLAVRWPDVMLVDIQMPGMDGLSFIDEVRKEPTLDALPIVVMTGSALPESTALSRGADGWLQKPFTIEELDVAVTEAISAVDQRTGRQREDRI